jgi:hypothetical protein
MSKGPDFLKDTVDTLAKRAAQLCSRPDCQKITSGPHSEEAKAINLGEAAHIKGARLGSKRYDPSMTDEERRHILNGIWLCRLCAKEIDTDEQKFPVKLLREWKKEHEQAVVEGRRGSRAAAREINVKGGGVGSKIDNSGDGIALELIHDGKEPAERITVDGQGVGEIISNTGRGTAKRIISTGGGTGSETSVHVTQPVGRAVGMSSKVVITDCKGCGQILRLSKVIQGFAGDEEPKVEAKCSNCGTSTWI